jgi:hypothetical protein
MHRASYWKTTVIASAGLVLSASTPFWLSSGSMPQWVVGTGYALAAFLFIVTLAIISGGLLCLWRDARETSGKPDLFAPFANRAPTGGAMARLGLRFLLGPKLRPGDWVQVRPGSEIRATLDAAGALDGLPFMAEMEAYCGKIFRVHRRVDKINDMRHKTGLRRMHDAVTLTEVRCSGSQHDGCEAECQILWKDSWLKRLRSVQPLAPHRSVESFAKAEVGGRANAREYVCQMTQLWEASEPMSRFDPRPKLRPLLSGNLGFRGCLIAVLTRIFNYVQGLRGGALYPFMPSSPGTRAAALANLGLQPNESVVVRSKEEIAQTLANSRNRGLWFDREMIRYCGQPAVVRKRVSRIIHEATRTMVEIKTPCIVLENVVATGEFLQLCPQHEYIFWRENWLKRPEKTLHMGS